MAYQDYYAALGVDRQANADQIRRAYRKLARQYHPDVNKDPGAEERFKQINEAYEVLSDPEKRSVYDRYGSATPPETGGWGEVPESGDFSEFFQQLFGGGFGRGRARGPMRGGDYQVGLSLSLEEAYRGGRRNLQINGQSVSVDIPAGARDGTRIRVAGGGGSGNPPGDLVIQIKLAPHPLYRLEGDDLYLEIPVPAPIAVIGGKVRVPTLDGPVELTIPPHTQSGRTLRLRGQGWPRAAGRGDLYAAVRIVIPEQPSPTEEELYRKLAQVIRAEGVS